MPRTVTMPAGTDSAGVSVLAVGRGAVGALAGVVPDVDTALAASNRVSAASTPGRSELDE